MHTHDLDQWQHDHHFGIDDGQGEKRTRQVVVLTLVTMVIEIAAGYAYGSMALLADGWHMGTHAAALGIAVLAYVFARKHSDDPRFSFGTGKVGALGGFGSAIILAVVALIMVAESIQRILTPETIRFTEAIVVAVIGLAVNLLSAVILQGGHNHHDHHHHDHQDHNLKAAYLHVLADALTSVLAIVALLTGKFFAWIWMDPLMGIVGAVIIVRWAYGLLKESGSTLLDSGVEQQIISDIKSTIEMNGDNKISDIHVWKVGASHLAASISVVTGFPKPPDYYKNLLSRFRRLRHLIVEVNPCPGNPAPTTTDNIPHQMETI
ncbi:MAG: CDF family Co(II)/Ni(II) efflux transporter DmeF [Proteobacteria bacterium]|nr:CDF family Co(II)/Ni(II) efflux transporter DmeF [Pseudomonadota bacterium]